MHIQKVLNSSVVLVQDDSGEESILLGKGITDDIPVTLQPKFGNRHGLVAGAVKA